MRQATGKGIFLRPFHVCDPYGKRAKRKAGERPEEKTAKEKERMNKRYLYAVLVIAVMISVFLMRYDTCLSGDEIVTYGMANSSSGGWMLSTGRVAAYLESEIIGDSPADTGRHLVQLAGDVIKNKRQAAYFSYPRPSESGWYDGEEIWNWFHVTPADRFTFGRVYLNAMGDDANTFLYYCLVHLVSSIFPAISAAKWSAFIVNIICLLISIVLLYRICGVFTDTETHKLLVCLIYIFSVGCLFLTTYLRAYMLITAIHLALLLLHLRLYESIRKQDFRRFRQRIVMLLALYPIGYVSHYTTGLWGVTLGLMTIVYIMGHTGRAERKRYLTIYILSGAAAVILGVLLDPVSLPGLLTKLSGTDADLLTSVRVTADSAVVNLFGSKRTCILVILLLLAGWFRRKKTGDHGEYIRQDRVLPLYVLGAVLGGYCVFVALVMKGAYFKTIYPLLCMTIVLGLCGMYGGLFSRRKLARCIVYLGAAAYIYGNVTFMFASKDDERKKIVDVGAALEAADTDELVFLRGHAQGYEYFQLLPGRYEQVLFITTTDDAMGDFVSESDLKQGRQYTALVTNGENIKEDFEAAVKENPYLDTIETVYTGGEVSVLKLNMK